MDTDTNVTRKRDHRVLRPTRTRPSATLRAMNIPVEISAQMGVRRVNMEASRSPRPTKSFPPMYSAALPPGMCEMA